jgi:hypothetical protein
MILGPRHLLRWAIALLAGAAIHAGTVAADTYQSLPDQTQLPFNWSNFGVGGFAGRTTVQGYNRTDGTAGGPLYVTNTHIFDNDPDPKEPRTEDIGVATFQYALFRGSTNGAGGATNRLGAAFMGGFRLTDTDDETRNWSFLQIFTDARDPNGVIDGGGARGKVNGDLPGWNRDPGWNFAGNQVQYDYLDLPSDPSTRAETVSFETALVCFMGNDVLIRGDWTWSFTTDGRGGLSGMDVTSQAAASNRLVTLYQNAHPGTTYMNIGVGTCHMPPPAPTPEPSSLASACLGGVVLLGYWRTRHRRRSAA